MIQTIILVLFFLTCAVLIFLVLIQSGKGGSLGILGGGGGNSPLGSSSMDAMTKATWYASILFFVLAILAAWAFAESGPSDLIDELQSDAPAETAPADGMGQDAQSTEQSADERFAIPEDESAPDNPAP